MYPKARHKTTRSGSIGAAGPPRSMIGGVVSPPCHAPLRPGPRAQAGDDGGGAIASVARQECLRLTKRSFDCREPWKR